MKADPAVFDRIAGALARPGDPSSDFDLNPPLALPPGRRLRPAAVLCAIEEGPAGSQVILTKRSSALKHHPGQIAFPGGKQDAGDADATATALREAREEIGLPQDCVEVLGFLPPHETVTGFQVSPVVARVLHPFEECAEPGEVAEVFRVPLSHLLRPESYSIQSRRWRGNRRYYYTVPYGPYYIWGATARMLRVLAERLS
ncbi:CoA pyrophosphatase [Pseudooceanicola sp. CBS1P-1]|uniref:CoA pyrophosphatase n=1 Tax=Pseudooceanicola albus TaxID=2692189 RepID=A0A6L7G2B2_9RHOB|nr:MULTISPECIES: CoA pyrophosphatase [Pseudooceanicola]MBT9383863.1 CoA pyrophosphatase [Pseudooceanicola endophyticus]MXN16723.1 CoA pyrophosphatase [Pseudooceanicola albus]